MPEALKWFVQCKALYKCSALRFFLNKTVQNPNHAAMWQIYIQRISGCDHMQCRQCDTKFCYRCGERRFKLKMFGYRLEDHDMKHSIIGCKHKYDHNKPLRRMFTRGGIFGRLFIDNFFSNWICFIFTARSSYASAVLGIIILSVRLSVCLSVCLSHACFVTKRKNILPIVWYDMKG